MGVMAFPFSAVLDVTANTLLGNSTGSAAAAQALTAAQVRTLCSLYSTSEVDTLLAAKAPSSHTHGNITNAGAIGSTSGVPIITGASGVLQAGSFGSTSGTFCQGNDSRLSDARTPTAHKTTHATGGTDALTAADIGAAATSHTHAAADITSGTIATARLASGTANSTTYLRGDQTWASVSAGISTLNTLTDATQTFATGTTGTDFAISSATGVHTFNLPSASATARGVVTTGAQTFGGVKTFDGADVNGGPVGGGTWRLNIDSSQFNVRTTLSRIAFGNSGGGVAVLRNTDPVLEVTGNVRFGGFAATFDMFGEAENVAAFRRSTNAQTVRIYNTFTSTTSFERLNIAWASNICTIETEKGSAGGTLRGLRIGGSSSALVGLWGATPIVQPTTAVAAATRVGGGGTTVTDSDTFDGYTLAQIVKALRNIGFLA